MKVTKQTLIDWTVEVEGQTVAWIRKEKDGLGYKLEYKAGSQTVSEFYFNFREAKVAAKTL